MNDVQDGHENSRDCKGETEGCQWHVLDELCSDWSCLSFLPISRRVSLSPTHFPFLPFSLPRPLSLLFLSLFHLFPRLERRSVGLDEPTNQAVNGNEAKLKRMMVPVTRDSGRGRVCEINNFHGPAKNNTRSDTSYLRKGLRNAGRRDALCAA